MTYPSLPIIDFAALQGAPDARRQMLARLGKAAREVGFFYLVGHGLSESAQRETLALAARFFALPPQEKLAVQMVHSPHFRGYNQVGAELTRARPDLREQFDIMNEETALDAATLTQPWQRLTGPNQWPATLPGMKAQLLAWQEKLSDISLTLLAAFAEVLAQPAGVSRLSCAFFMAARLDATVPLLSLSPELAALAEGPQSDPANPLFYQVGENVLKGRLRSHPDVAARHYGAPMAQGRERTAGSVRPEPEPA